MYICAILSYRSFCNVKALGQCSRFLETYLPHATIVPTLSTAAAAQAVLSKSSEGAAAAICSKLCTVLFLGLNVLQEGIQNEAGMVILFNE